MSEPHFLKMYSTTYEKNLVCTLGYLSWFTTALRNS